MLPGRIRVVALRAVRHGEVREGAVLKQIARRLARVPRLLHAGASVKFASRTFRNAPRDWPRLSVAECDVTVRLKGVKRVVSRADLWSGSVRSRSKSP